MAIQQSFTPFDCYYLTNFKSWAQAVGNALSAFGWTKDSDPGSYMVNWSTIATPYPAGGCPVAAPQRGFNPRGAWASGTSYVSGSGWSGVTQSAGGTPDMVTYGGQTWVCVENTQLNITNVAVTSNVATITISGVHYFNPGSSVTIASLTHTVLNGTWTIASIPTNTTFTFAITTSNITSVADTGTVAMATAPSSDIAFYNSSASPITQMGHWIPYNYEVWKSTGPQSATNPIYLKIVYTCAGTNGANATTTNIAAMSPCMIIAVGTNHNGYGTVGGNFFDPTNLGYSEYYLQTTSYTTTYANLECDFSGDADNFRMIMFRNGYALNNGIPWVIAIDRARDLYGNTLDTYWTVCTAKLNYAQQASVMKPAIGGQAGGCFSGWGCISLGGIIGNQGHGSFNGTTPAVPVFPLVGVIGQPHLGMMTFYLNDVSDGQVCNVVMYGASHTYLVTKCGTYVQNSNAYLIPAILWE
jgi:hypothetical protein